MSGNSTSADKASLEKEESRDTSIRRSDSLKTAGAPRFSSQASGGELTGAAANASSSSSPPPPPPPPRFSPFSSHTVGSHGLVLPSFPMNDGSTTAATPKQAGAAATSAFSSTGPKASSLEGDRNSQGRSSPPLASSARALPSPPRPDRLSQTHSLSGLDPNPDEHPGGSENAASQLTGSRRATDASEQHFVSDTPKHAAPLYLAATASFRSAEEDAKESAAAASPSDEAAHAEHALPATTTSETPQGAATDQSQSTSLLSPSPHADAEATSASRQLLLSADRGPEDGAEAVGRWRRGASKEFYMEEAEDFATMYKNAGLIPPDLDELEDEVLLGRSLSPALLMAKQRELSQLSRPSPPASSSSSNIAAGATPLSLAPRPNAEAPRNHHTAARASFSGSSATRFAAPGTSATVPPSHLTPTGSHDRLAPFQPIRAVPRGPIVHTTHYPYAHGMPMPVFVGSGSAGAGGGGSSNTAPLSRHTSMPHSLAASTTGHHDGQAGLATSEAGSKGGETKHAHHSHKHQHDRRHHHHHHHRRDASSESRTSHDDTRKPRKTRSGARKHSRHAASATLPNSPGSFPVTRAGPHAASSLSAKDDPLLARVPDSPILPEPHYHFAQSTLQPNEKAPHFPRSFGYLATDDDGAGGDGSSLRGSPTTTATSTTTTTARTSTTVTPTSKEPNAARAGEHHDVLYSLVPSTRVSSGCVSPSAVTPGSSPAQPGTAIHTSGGEEDDNDNDNDNDNKARETLGVHVPVSHGTAVPSLMRANTAPNITQEDTQRQLQEALSALGLYMRSEGTSIPAGPSQTQAQPVLAAPTHAATPHPLAPSSSAVQAAPPQRSQLAPEGTLSTPVAPQTPQSEFPTIRIPDPGQVSEPMNAADALWGSAMPTFEPQFLGTPLNAQRRSLTVPSVNSLLVPANNSGQTQASGSTQKGPTSTDGSTAATTTTTTAAGAPSQAASFTPSMSFNPVRNASFLLNASFGQLANFSLLREGSISSSKISQQNRSALVMELERRRDRIAKQLAQQKQEATMGNVFALVRGSNAWQLQYLLQEGLVDVNERDYNGCTPLHVAALEGNQAIARILLSFGADVLAVDRWGRTPLDCAAVNRHGSVGRYLLAVIRNKQQHKQGRSQDHDASSQAVAAALEGEDSMPPTPFGLSAPTHNSHNASGLEGMSSGTPSTAPGTAASTMPDTLSVSPHGLGPNTSSSSKEGGGVGVGGEWQDEASGDAMTRLLVPGGELVERKHEQSLQRRRVRRDSATGLPGSLETAGDEGDMSCDSAHHDASSMPNNNSTTVAPLTLVGKEHEDSTTTAAASSSISAPSTPWATAATAGPDSTHGSHLTSASASIGAPVHDSMHADSSQPASFSSSLRSRQKQIHAVSRGRSRRPKTEARTQQQQSALFAAEEDKFLEEQEEQIAEEVSVAAGVPIGSPTFYPKALARSTGSASSPASTGPSSVPTALPASMHTADSPAPTAGELSEASKTNAGADVTPCPTAKAESESAAAEANGLVDSAASHAAANVASALTAATHRDAREEEAHKARDAEEAEETANSGPRFSVFTTISDTVSLIVCMCGLPGRGKSFISKRLVRYINWKGVPCRVFNAGNYRRQMLGVAGTSDAAFFDPNNPQGKEMRERMAELACEDLVRFIASHVLAVGILDATNTTKARRTRLKHFFENECQKFGLSYRMLFIESVCTDETIITENILRSKCDNDDFKDVQDTNEVIAEFRDRIHQYEKVYETLDPCEGLPFIKIINVKHHVIIHKVDSGLGSRIAFFLQNLHPVAYPIYIVMAGETYGDQQGVFGGDERLTDRGEEFAVALKQFIQDRYVPNMVVLHATNPSVLSTLRPLMEGGHSSSGGGGSAGYDPHSITPGSPTMSQSAASTATRTGGVVSLKDDHAARASTGVASGSVRSQSGTKQTSPNTSTSSPTGQRHSHRSSPASRGGSHYVFPTELPPRKLHQSTVSADELARLAGGDVHSIAITSPSSTSPHGQQGRSGVSLRHSSSSGSSSSSPSRSRSSSSSCSSSDTTSSHGSEDDEDEEEEAEEVLCPVPGLDNVNFGRFSGHSAGWVREKYPRLSALLYISALDDEAKNEACARASQATSPTASAAHGSPVTALAASRTSSQEHEGVPRALALTVSPPCSAKLKDGGLAWFKHAPSHMDPLLAYCVQFPNGESCRQVNARLEPALMAVMRTQSPVFVVAPAVPAQGMLAFFADVIPELSPTLRIPRHCVIELGVKDDVTVHPLVPGAGISGVKAPSSPLMDEEEIQEALKMASTLAVSAATAESSPREACMGQSPANYDSYSQRKAVKRVLPHHSSSSTTNTNDNPDAVSAQKNSGTRQAPPPLERDASLMAEVPAAASPRQAEEDDTVDFDDGVDDFLGDVIAGKTDKLRKEIAEKRLLSAAEEVSHNNNNNTNNSIGGGQSMFSAGGGAAGSGWAGGEGSLAQGSLSRASGAVPATSWALSNNASAQLGNGSAGLPNDSRLSQKSSPSYMSSAARSLQNYELIAYLGSGTFAEVTLARQRMTSELYAIKKISKQRVREEGCVERTFTERQLLASLRHPFLVQLYQAFQSRLYLYLVIDFAQGGDLYYFTEKTIWVKEMKRSLKKFKYPYYTNGGGVQASVHKSQRDTALTMSVTDAVVASPLEGSSSANREHHRHHHRRSASWQGHESDVVTDTALSDVPQQDRLRRGGETDKDTQSRHRRALTMKQSKSANDLAIADRPAHRPRRHAKEAMKGSPALFTPPSQALSSQSRLIELDAAGLTTKPTEAHDESDTDVPMSSMQALPASDPFSQETVENLRRQMHQRQLERQLGQRVALDVGNGTDTDGNTDAMVSALAGVGASPSTLNAVRAGEYYTTDAIDEFAGAKDVFSDAATVSHTTAKMLPPRVMPGDAGGEVANKAEEHATAAATAAVAAARGDDDDDEDGQKEMLPQRFVLSEDTVSPHNEEDESVSSAVSQRLAAQKKRRRDVERSRAQAHGGNAGDDDDDEEEEVEEHRKRTPKEARSRQTSVPTMAVSPSARLPPTFRKHASRRSSGTVTAASSMLLDDGETMGRERDGSKPLGPTVAPTVSSSGPSSRNNKSSTAATAGNMSFSQKKMKRAPKSASDLTALRADESQAEGYGTSTSSIGGRHGGSRRSRGDAMASSRSMRPKPARGSAVTIHDPYAGGNGDATLITSEITLEQTTAATDASGLVISAGDMANGDSPLPRKRGCTTPTANRSERHRGGALSPSSAHGSHRAHHSRSSAPHSAAATPSQSLVASTPLVVHKVDLNAPFHETKTDESGVSLPNCAPDDSRLPLRLIAFYAVEVGLVLQYLHTSGFIYRDLKPENILMRRDGHIMLTDFGVAKHRKGAAVTANAATGSGDTDANATNANNTNTNTNNANSGARATSFTGTAPYMSPEMVQGLPHDTRTDWWSFGCLLFEWCNGRKAYDEANQFALFRSIVEQDVKVTPDDFQLTALELHSRTAQLHYRHQEFILTTLHKQFASLPQESQSNVVAALADASFSHYNHTVNADAADEVARAALESSPVAGASASLASGGATPPVLHIQSPNGHVLDPLGASRDELAVLQHSQNANSLPMPSAMNPSMSRIPKELLQSLAGTPTNLSFQFAPDGSISATVGTTNPFAGITGEHLGIAAYETFMRWAIEQEKEALALLEDLIRALLNRNVQERLCGVDVLEHPFFQCTYVTSQLYYSHYVKMQYPHVTVDEADGNDGAVDAESSGVAAHETNEGAADTPPPPSSATATPTYAMSRNSAGEPDLSPEAFLRLQPPVRRPDAWVDLFEERRIPPVYMPRLRTQDDLRYFPSAVTATGLSAAAEQQKRIKEAKGKKREMLRHAVEQAAQQSGAVMTEDENGVYLSLPAGTSAHDLSGTPLHDLGGSQAGSASGSMGASSLPPALGSPADLLRRVSSSLSGGTLLAASALPVADPLLATAALPDSDTPAMAAAAVAAAPPVDAEAEADKASPALATKSSVSQGVSFEDAAGSGKTNETVLFSEAAASSDAKSASSMVDSLTAHLASLIADISSQDDDDDDSDNGVKETDKEDVGAIAQDPVEEGVLSDAVPNASTAHILPEQLPASPQLVDVRLSASPLVAPDAASDTAFSVVRTSASAGDEPHELCHTQPMLAGLSHISLSSADESEDSEAGDRRSSDGRDSRPAPEARHLRQETSSTLARVRQRPLVVPSIDVMSSTSPAFTLTSPLPLDDGKEAETKDAQLHAEKKLKAPLTSAPLVSLHSESDAPRGSDPAHRRSAEADDPRASLVSCTGDHSNPLFRESHPLQSFNEDEEAELSAGKSGWTLGDSSSTATSTPGFRSPDESGSATTAALSRPTSRGPLAGGSKEDEEEEVEDDFMARTAVLPSDFVKAALAVAAAKQQQQQFVSLLPTSEEKPSTAVSGAGPPTKAGQPDASPQTPPPPVLPSQMPAKYATDGTLLMAPTAVMVAHPNIAHDLAEPGSPAVGAGHAATASAAVMSESQRRASLQLFTQASDYMHASSGLGGPSNGADVAAALVDDPTAVTHYLNVDTTGGYYETDALEEGDASGVEGGEDLLHAKESDQADEEEEDPDDALLTSVTGLPGVIREGRVGSTRGPTSTPSSMLNRRQHTTAFGSEPSLSLEDPSAATVSPSTAKAALPSGRVASTQQQQQQPVLTVLPVDTTRTMPLVIPTGALHQAVTTAPTTREIAHDRPLMDSVECISTLPAFSSSDDVTMRTHTTNADSRLSTPERSNLSTTEAHGESRPLFAGSADSSLTSSAHRESVQRPLTEGGPDSVGDEMRMRSHTIVPSADGSGHTKVPSGTMSNMGDVAEVVSNDVAERREDDEEEIDAGELSAPIDLLGYEEDEESGNAGVESSVDADEETYTDGSFDDDDDEGDEEGSQSAYSDEDNEGSQMDVYSGSESSRTTTSSRASDREKAVEPVAMQHTSSSSSSSSSSSNGEAGFGTDQNLSFSVGRGITTGSPAPGGTRGMTMSMSGAGGLGNYSALSGNASNLGGASSGMRMPAGMAMSGSQQQQQPWGGSYSAGETNLATALRGHAGPTGVQRVSSLGSPQQHPSSARAAGGNALRPGAQSFSAASGTAGSYARAPYSAASGAMSPQPQPQQPWWRTSYSSQAQVSGSGRNAGSFAQSGPVLSPTSSAQHGYQDFPLNALYAPVNTLSGISYDVEDDVHSPRHTSRAPRDRTEGGGEAVAATQGTSAFRRFTQPFQNNASWTAGVHGRQGGATPQAASARPATLFTTSSRTPVTPATAAAAAAATTASETGPFGALQQHMTEDNLSDGGGSVGSGSGFMGYTFNGAHGGGPAAAAAAPAVRRSAAPVTPTSRTANVFSVTNVARAQPAPGNVSDEQESSSANLANNPDHFANFSFFSAPSGLLPGGYGGNNNNNNHGNY